MLEVLEDVPYIGEKIKKARSEGREQGLKDGLIEGLTQVVQQGMRVSILEILENRFQSVDGIKKEIDSITEIDQLKTIFRMAIKAESLEVLKNFIAKMKN